MRAWRTILLGAALGLVTLQPLAGQAPAVATAAVTANPPRAHRTRGPQRPDYPVGTVRRFDSGGVDSLIHMLDGDTEDWANVVSFYFGSSYTPHFADLVIFLHAGQVKQALVQGGRTVPSGVLRGQRYVYVLFFSTDTMPMGVDSTQAWSMEPAERLHVRLTVEGYQVDPLLSRLLSTVLQKLSLGGGSASDSERGDAQARDEMDLHDVALGPSSRRLYAGFLRLPLGLNTWNRISVFPGAGRRFPSDQWTVANMANASGSWLGLSLAMGVTFDARTFGERKDSTFGRIGQDARANLYLLAHLNAFKRPVLPGHNGSSRRSYGIFIGTNVLTGAPLSEIVVGASADRLWGDLGIAAGGNLLASQLEDMTDNRLLRFFVGLQFPL